MALLALAWPVNGGVLFDYGTTWKYFVGTSEASSPDAAAWRRIGFSDSKWPAGAGPIGYANPPSSVLEETIQTVLPTSAEGNYLSVFLRQTFVIHNPGEVSQLTLNINVDDGYVAWINGTEVARYNVPDGDLPYNATAASANEENLITTTITNNLPALLVAGTNVLAVQVFNGNSTSSDLFFDASLASDIDESSPVLVEINPAAKATVRELHQIEVYFDRNVAGVNAADLWINGLPATGLTTYSPRNYLFQFSQPAAGTITVDWAPNPGITDALNPARAFAGGAWSYTLDPAAPVVSVAISEFMADNQNGIRDDLGHRSDWIELHNRGALPASLEGWFLTDTTNNLTQWRFPAKILSPNQYLLVWASGENRTNPSAPLHTNFKLDKAGGYLALLEARTNVISEFSPIYPAQRANISYGRDRLDPSMVGYFQVATPGAQNATTGPGFAPEPAFSLDSGIYTNDTLTLTLSGPSGSIRYTTNGSEPVATSSEYLSPIVITGGLVVKARIFQAGLLPSPTVARTYHLVDASTRVFSSNLPLLVINTSGRGISQDSRLTNASVVVIDTFRGRSTLLQPPEFQGLCQIESRGQTSAGFPKTPYRLELNDAMGNDLNAGFLGLPADADWVLRNPYSDKCLMNDFLAHELHEKMGHYSPRRRFVEVFVSSGAGKLRYPQNYQGIYVLLEKIEADQNRVKIAQMSPLVTTEPDISGGYIVKKDKDSPGDRLFSTTGGAGFSGQQLRYHEPKPAEITTAQQNWIRNYLNQFERALYASNWMQATGTNHYSYYIDIDSFVDAHWIVEYTKQIDGYRLSNYMHKDRGGKLHMDPIWDWNLSFGNADYLDGWLTSGWYYALLGENEHIWLRRLISGSAGSTGKSGDPDFNQQIADRWSILRTNVLAATNVLSRVDELAALLSEAAARDFSKYPRLGTYVWPNPSFYVTPTTYAGIITAMKQWISGRSAWIDSQFLRSPSFNAPGGLVPPGFNLVMSAPAGTVYYTLDGTDPRLSGGAASPSALIYRGPVSLAGNARAFARARNGSNWSGPATATFVVQTPPLVLTEIMYHPAKPDLLSTNLDEDFEYLEFMNRGSVPLALNGFRLSGAVDFVFPSIVLGPQERVLVVRSRAAFEQRYGAGQKIAGEYAGKLGNGGAHLVLQGPLQEPIVDFDFDDQWYPITDGAGFSLVVVDENAPTATWAYPASWRPSSRFNGSPGQADPAPTAFPQVVISEVLAHASRVDGDLIELQNLSPTEANIGGWLLTDEFDTVIKFRIPEGTTIAPGGFLVFTENDFNSPAKARIPFGLNQLGETIYLFSGDAHTHLTGYVHGFEFGAQTIDVTLGRYLTGKGTEHFVAQRLSTLGATNAGPWIGPVVISEIMYRPADVYANGAYWNNTEDEFIELQNRSNAPVSLFNSSHPTNTWRLARAVEFIFPTNTVVPAGGFLVVVSFDPARFPTQAAAFRARFGVPAHVPILGPFSGHLSNAHEPVELYRPDSPLLSGPNTGEIPWILVERVGYSDQPPWTPAADGVGFALSRQDLERFGNDPDNWTAATPTPGRPNAGGTPPHLASQPQSQMALVSQTVRFTVAASSSDPLRFQWRFHGHNLAGATNATLVLTNLQPAQAGAYQVMVLNTVSSAVSNPAWLTVDTDSDGDGMGDTWELAQGLNPYDPLDALADPDQDGLSNRNEYRAGTDPHNPQSCLKFDGIAASDPVVLWFTAVSNRTYTVLAADSLTSANWAKLADIESQTTTSSAKVIDDRTGPYRFYRLVTPAQP